MLNVVPNNQNVNILIYQMNKKNVIIVKNVTKKTKHPHLCLSLNIQMQIFDVDFY